MCRSPELIAACHVLLRLLMPRHSPCALFRLIYWFSRIMQAPFGSVCRNCLLPNLLQTFAFCCLLVFSLCSVFNVQIVVADLTGCASAAGLRPAPKACLRSVAPPLPRELQFARRTGDGGTFPQIGAQRSGSDLERKKEPTDMQFSRRLRKPRKRNGVGCF